MENGYGNGPQTAGRFGVAHFEIGAGNDEIARRAGRSICRHAIRNFIRQQEIRDRNRHIYAGKRRAMEIRRLFHQMI